MKSKKIILIGSLLLCAALVMGLLMQSTRGSAEAATTLQITLSNETANPGEDVTVAVNLAENPGLMVIMMRLRYDHDRLMLTGAKGVGLTGWDLTGDKLLWLGSEDNSRDGTILELNFRVRETAETGTAEVTVECGRGDVGNHDEQKFVPAVTAGSVTVGDGGGTGGTTPEPTTEELPFTDVPEGSPYYDAVVWAYGNGVTAGRARDTFDPAGTCTRAEIVTFLWRAVGSPEPTLTETPFEDVRENKYYYEPVLWAFENEIIKGVSAARFSPHATCSTAEIVTMIYRALGIGSDGWYQTAGDWANGAGLLEGTDLLVDPHEACPRSAVVTVLYRWSRLR